MINIKTLFYFPATGLIMSAMMTKGHITITARRISGALGAALLLLSRL
ncbi:hypothetical protein [uncultured Roseovarius sp.]|nr:hypothetical protein [uncultured Roseovarius sp.]